MAGYDIVVIGASAGGVEALSRLVGSLPADLPAAIFVVVHFPSDARSVLPQILSRAGPLPAVHPVDGEMIRPGKIYIAPPNCHLLLERGMMRVTSGPREHGFRPAIDTLFRSAASAYGPRVIGVILSGTLYDGAAGMIAIKRRGGITIVQDPEEALFSRMPLSAIETQTVDHIFKLKEIAGQLSLLASQSEKEGVHPIVEPIENGQDLVQNEIQEFKAGFRTNESAIWVCPECGGVLWEITESGQVQYRCHVGHTYSDSSLDVEQSNALEAALWTAARALEDKAALSSRLASLARQRGHSQSAARFLERAENAEQSADVIRKLILNGKVLNTVESEGAAQVEQAGGNL